jgi:phosphate transport system substrate-binding protein
MLTVAALIASMATGLTTVAAAESLTGAGSTLVAPLMAQWTADFQKKTGTEVTYGGVGSGAGIAQITARSVDFGASDAPLKPSQAQACKDCFQIPWALGAVALAYHLDGVPKLKLTGEVVSNIYLGNITNWNSPSIKRLNPGVNLPDLKITPAFRSDGSGTTYGFTNWLWKVSQAWKSKIGIYSTAVNFPTGVGGRGNDGVTSVVSSTNGSIGYVEVAYALTHNLRVAAIRNRAGKFIYPNLANIKAAGDRVKTVPASNELHIVDPPKTAPKAYPVATFTYVIVPKVTSKRDVLSQFILYALGAGQKFGPALDFAPIPKVVYNAGIATTKKFQAG